MVVGEWLGFGFGVASLCFWLKSVVDLIKRGLIQFWGVVVMITDVV